jgi:hypothetical protein
VVWVFAPNGAKTHTPTPPEGERRKSANPCNRFFRQSSRVRPGSPDRHSWSCWGEDSCGREELRLKDRTRRFKVEAIPRATRPLGPPEQGRAATGRLNPRVGGSLRPPRELHGNESHAITENHRLVRPGTTPGSAGECRLCLLPQTRTSPLSATVPAGSGAGPAARAGAGGLQLLLAAVPDLCATLTGLAVSS